MITHTKMGGRTIELFVPYEFKGKKVTKIAFGPPTLGHLFAWQAGEYTDALELMSDLAGVEVAAIRAIPYPDADRVMQVFLEMLPLEIRDTIGKVSGREEAKPEVGAQPATEQLNGEAEAEPPHPYLNADPPPNPQPQATARPPNPVGVNFDVGH